MSVRSAVLDVVVDVSANNLDTFSTVGAGARGLGDDLDSAASKATSAAAGFDGVSASAENLDDKAGKATGAMGALSSGFELIGADKAAAALQGAAMATDFLSGAGQALNLVMDLEIVKKTVSTARTIAHTTATVAATAASKAAAAGQWALNAALSANPLGIVIALLVAIAAGLVIAYQRSDTFRAKVDAAMGLAKAAVGTVVDVVKDVIAFFGDIPAKVSAIPEAVTKMKNAAVPVLEALLTPIVAVKDAVMAVVDWIGKIDFPSPPDWLSDLVPGNGRVRSNSGLGTTSSTTSSATVATTDPAVVDLLTAIRDLIASASSSTSYVDESTLARLIASLLRREGILFGAAS